MLVAAFGLVFIGGAGGAVAAPAPSPGEIASVGPLVKIRTTPDLNCAVNYAGDSRGEFYGDTACGTFLAVNGTLYGPANLPAGQAASPRTPFRPVSQLLTGRGTADSPYLLKTTVSAGGLYTVTQEDSYIVGQQYFSTKVQVTTTSLAGGDAVIYRAGDCFLGDNDTGGGKIGQRWVACTSPSGRAEEWIDTSGQSTKAEGYYGDIWAAVGSQHPFGNTCACNQTIDNGAGLSWKVAVGPAQPAVISHQLSFIQPGDPITAGSKYVALGDSYSSGEGISPYYANGPNRSDACHRSVSGYPELITGQGRSQLDTPIFVACTGATTQDLMEPNHDPAHSGELAQTDPLNIKPDTKYVTLTVGGDDVGFAAILTACIKDNDCTRSSEYRDLDARISALKGGPQAPNIRIYSWKSVLQKIRAQAPEAKILIAGYPDLINPNGSGFGSDNKCYVGRAVKLLSGTPIGAFTITRQNAQRISDAGHRLNQELESAVQNSGMPNVEYVDVESKFRGKLICDPHPALNAMVPSSDWNFVESKSFHPKPEGQTTYAQAFLNSIG